MKINLTPAKRLKGRGKIWPLSPNETLNIPLHNGVKSMASPTQTVVGKGKIKSVNS